MSDPIALLEKINLFYRRWAAIEDNFGTDKGSVLDWDYCPEVDLGGPSAVTDRLSALHELEKIQHALAAADRRGFCNHHFLVEKLAGANAYLRALLGQRIPFKQYLHATIGIEPRRNGSAKLEQLAHHAEQLLAAHDIKWSPDQRHAFDALTLFPDPQKFGQSLKEHAARWVEQVQSALGLEIEPNYEIVEVVKDEYWHNWIDGRRGEPIRLQVNLHPRNHFRRGQDEVLAAHEIAAHAVQVLQLDKEREAGRLDSSSMNLAVHSCETFQMEGLAQTILHLLSDDQPSEQVQLIEAVWDYHRALINDSQIDIENGEPIDQVVSRIERDAPFLTRLTAMSDLRDRSHNPLFRAYVHVYDPSAHTFMRAKKLSQELRYEFLQLMYTGLYTPPQIESILDELEGREAGVVGPFPPDEVA